jgi:hypothetical protein
MNRFIIKEVKVSSGNPVNLVTLALDIIAYTLMLEMVRQRWNGYDY